MVTKSGIPKVEDIKDGMILFGVMSYPTARGFYVGEIEVITVTKRPHYPVTQTDSRLYKSTYLAIAHRVVRSWAPEGYIDTSCCSDRGVFKKGKFKPHNTNRLFVSRRKAEKFRQRQLRYVMTDQQWDQIHLNELSDRYYDAMVREHDEYYHNEEDFGDNKINHF